MCFSIFWKKQDLIPKSQNSPCGYHGSYLKLVLSIQILQYLSDAPVPPLDPAGPLVDGGQVRVHVAGEAATARHLVGRCQGCQRGRAFLGES